MQVIQIGLLKDRLYFPIAEPFVWSLFFSVNLNDGWVPLVLAKHDDMILLNSIKRLAHNMFNYYLCFVSFCIQLY